MHERRFVAQRMLVLPFQPLQEMCRQQALVIPYCTATQLSG
jgi:hypothetical protein